MPANILDTPSLPPQPPSVETPPPKSLDISHINPFWNSPSLSPPYRRAFPSPTSTDCDRSCVPSACASSRFFVSRRLFIGFSYTTPRCPRSVNNNDDDRRPQSVGKEKEGRDETRRKEKNLKKSRTRSDLREDRTFGGGGGGVRWYGAIGCECPGGCAATGEAKRMTPPPKKKKY